MQNHELGDVILDSITINGFELERAKKVHERVKLELSELDIRVNL
ncbi:hypothetical protein [Saccharolobus shibatae]|nr:hypothetical protein [Saccharolobus shibatae]